MLCSRFNDAPEVAIQTLLNRAQDAGVSDIALKSMILALPRPEEALAVKYDDGARVEDETEGCELKADQIKLRLSAKHLDNIGLEFFNAREDSVEPIRDRIVQRIVEQRRTYALQLDQLAKSVENLIENRQDEEVRVVFEHVCSDLGSWLDNNRTIESSDEGVQIPLVEAIDGTRYASTVRAAVRRSGDWYNLDYYHHLSYGVRKLAVAQIGARLGDFRVIAKNLLNNDELSVASEFLERVVTSIDAAADLAYKRVQTAGRETFKQTLESDFEFWATCEKRWGQGSGYRDSISDMTDKRFRESYEQAHRLVKKMIEEEWNSLMALLESMLRETSMVQTA